MYEDTYFLNAQEALNEASKQNRWSENNYYLQLCYYDGEKIESEFTNLIHMPIENLVELLANGVYRIPTKLEFRGLELSNEIKIQVLIHFNMSIEHAKIHRTENNNAYLKALRESKLDFSEPLRFYVVASTSTQVMQHAAKNIVDALQEMGYDVFFDLRNGIEDASCLKKILEFNPHATININHFNNEFLSDGVFNFVWFQDAMPILYSNEKIVLRKRDSVFVLIDDIKKLLDNREIKSELLSFMMNENIYKSRKEIKKEKKIVFIGSSYAGNINKMRNDSNFNELYHCALEIFEQKSCFKSLNHQESDIRFLMEKFSKTQEYIENIYSYLMRDYCIEKLCTINTSYKIEVYGHGWDENLIVSPHYMGILEYGEDISKVYNSATYGYCPGGYVLMQRTLECAFSETTPLVLDVRTDLQDVYDEKIEEAIEFFHINELENMLSKKVKEKKYDFIREQYSYKHFVNRCLEIINKEIS